MKKNAVFLALLLAAFSCGPQKQAKKEEIKVLTPKEQSIASIASLTAKGDQGNLRLAVNRGLDNGLTVNEIKEVLVQLYAYCGFPRSLNGLGTFMAVVKERQSKGLKDAEGPLPGAMPKGKSIDFGTENQTKLTGSAVKGELFDFAPAIDEYLKAHLFGDIFARDNLDWKTRELATIAALASMAGVESQLNSHIAIGKHNGLTDAQISDIMTIAGRDSLPPDVFPKGETVAANFTGEAWVSYLLNNKNCDIAVYNVTFAPKTRNNWHKHSVGQILLCTLGTGYYQERNKKARRLLPGDVVDIPADTEHWHGASPESEFVHIGITPKVSSNTTTWLEPVNDDDYFAATGGR